MITPDDLGRFALEHGPLVYLLLFGLFLFQTGFLIGPVIPGNPLLFAAGIVAAAPKSSVGVIFLILATGLGAFLGNMLNYQQGFAAGPAFKSRGKWVNQIQSAEAFFTRHGARTVAFAAFVPFIRAFVPFVAGMGKMSRTPFMISSVIGCFGWTILWCTLGYQLGKVPGVAKQANIIVFGIVGVVAVVAIIKLIMMRRKR